MGFIKGALFGVAVYATIKHITKKDILTGKSILDNLVEKTPEYIDRAKIYAKEVEVNLKGTVDPYNEYTPL